MFHSGTMLKTIFPNKKPFFDEEGNLFIPDDTIWFGDKDLSIKETMYLIIIAAAKGDRSDQNFKNVTNSKGMSRTTEWRIRKSLEEKGYL